MANKIKKLTKLSLDIIRTYGLSYYLHVAIEELENQKLDLLRGNIQIKKQQQQMQQSESEKYRAFLEKLSIGNRVLKAASRPTFFLFSGSLFFCKKTL